MRNEIIQYIKIGNIWVSVSFENHKDFKGGRKVILTKIKN